MSRLPVFTSLLAATGLLASAGVASGALVSTQDERGRTIRIDAQAPGVAVGDYARLLRNAVHGDEIETVTLRIVPEVSVRRLCRSTHARACYRGAPSPSIIVRDGDAARDAYTILHEYGHHVDASIRNARGPELNGTPRWWGTRAIGLRLARDQVSSGYALGWARSIGEIFAEDYAQLHVRGPYGIRWLPRPDETVFRAIRLDLTGRATGPAPRIGGTALVRPGAAPRGSVPRGIRRARAARRS